jgi:hypothetical protein
MLYGKQILLGAITLIATLGSRSMVHGQPQAVPLPAPGAASPPPQFRPLTEADAQADLAELKSAAAAVDQRFATAGDSAEGWKTYLSWAAFEAELQKPKPDPAALADVLEKLGAGYDGLELKWFANLRNVLGNYLFVSVPDGKLPDTGKEQINALVQELGALGANPTTDQANDVANRVLWLDRFRQAPELVKEARGRFSVPNFSTHIGKVVVDLGIGGPVDDVAPIDDVILGTTIHGTGRTVGQTRAALDADPGTAAKFATFDAVLNAVNSSNSIGRNGPVCIYTTGQTTLCAWKRFWIDETGVHDLPAVTSAQTCTSINNIVSIKGRRMVENIAWRRAGKQKAEAEAIAGQHAQYRLAARVDAQADPQIADANKRFETKLRAPLDERRAFPQSLKFSTPPSALAIDGQTVAEAQLAAPNAPPQLACQADPSRAESIIAVSVHESAVNNLAENVLTGMRLSDDMVQRWAVELTGSVPEKLKPDQNQEPFTVVFPPERIPRLRPVEVSFADNCFSITIHGQEFISGDRHLRSMNVAASYKFAKTADGYKAVRQGDVQIYDFGKKPGDKTKRSAREQGIYTAVKAKFGKVFEPEIKLKGFKFAQGKLAATGQWAPQEIIAQNGWLAIGYARAGTSSAAASSSRDVVTANRPAATRRVPSDEYARR